MRKRIRGSIDEVKQIMESEEIRYALLVFITGLIKDYESFVEVIEPLQNLVAYGRKNQYNKLLNIIENRMHKKRFFYK